MPTTQTHDPKEFIRGIQQILISDAKRIGFLCGAGTSIAVKKGASEDSRILGVKDMTKKIVDSVSEEKYVKCLAELKEEFKTSKTEFLIEFILSDLAQKELAIGKAQLCGLGKEGLGDLRRKIENKIKEEVSVHKKEKNFIKDLLHCDFAEWIGQASRKVPIEIFTTNYDYLFEMGLEFHSVPYFDGFVGGYKPFFDPTSVEDPKLLPQWTKFWKLHGSLGWDMDPDTHRIYRTFRDESTIMIYPSILKYDNSRKQPYVSFMDRLSNFIKSDDGVLFVCGYSFGDQHINDTVLNALDQTNSSHVTVLFHDDITDGSAIGVMARGQPNLSVYGKRNAIIGGKFGEWRLKGMPSKDDSIQIDSYFDEDATEPDKPWSGTGDFKLVDFSNFIEFLKTLHYENYRLGARA